MRGALLIYCDSSALLKLLFEEPESGDAIHLASAVSVRSDLTAFVAYDARLASAAEDVGLPVVQPGAARRRHA